MYNCSSKILEFDSLFPIVESSKLSLDDNFLQYIPKTEKQRELKEKIENVIRIGVPDFRHSIIDPSVNQQGEIYFEMGQKPGIGYTMKWWEDNAKKIFPSKNSRVGSDSQYYAFLAVLMRDAIRDLIESEFLNTIRRFHIMAGYSTEEEVDEVVKESIWGNFCDDSSPIAYYCDTMDKENWTKHGFQIQRTGSMPYGKWYDLANTLKIVKSKESGKLLFMSGSAYLLGCEVPVGMSSSGYVGETYSCSTGWIVCDI